MAGAGLSVPSGIPDFRSPGIMHSLIYILFVTDPAMVALLVHEQQIQVADLRPTVVQIPLRANDLYGTGR